MVGVPVRGAAAVVAVLLVLAGCASNVRLGLECPARPRPRGIVVLAHGVWPDGATEGWPDEIASLAEREGAVAAVVDFRCHLPEYFLGTAIEDAAHRVTRAVAELERAHARTACPERGLPVAGVGYSGGTTLLLKSALEGVRFRRLTFGGSPIYVGSDELAGLLERRSIERLVNYHSLVDGFVWPCVPIGVWGYSGRGSVSVDNRLTWEVHELTPYAGERARIARECVGSFGQADHACFADPGFRERVSAVVRYLEDRSVESCEAAALAPASGSPPVRAATSSRPSRCPPSRPR